VGRVCGQSDECSGNPGCAPAKQLLTREDKERRRAENPKLMTYTSGQCQEALGDWKFFWACPAADGDRELTTDTGPDFE
jgi:hypothetical protein